MDTFIWKQFIIYWW